MTFLNHRQDNWNLFNTPVVQDELSMQLKNVEKIKAKNLKPMCTIKKMSERNDIHMQILVDTVSWHN